MIFFAGKTLYELADATIFFHNYDYQSGSLSGEDFAKRISFCLDLLQDSSRCLQHEPVGSYEQYILQSCQGLIKTLEDFKRVIL